MRLIASGYFWALTNFSISVGMPLRTTGSGSMIKNDKKGRATVSESSGGRGSNPALGDSLGGSLGPKPPKKGASTVLG